MGDNSSTYWLNKYKGCVGVIGAGTEGSSWLAEGDNGTAVVVTLFALVMAIHRLLHYYIT